MLILNLVQISVQHGYLFKFNIIIFSNYNMNQEDINKIYDLLKISFVGKKITTSLLISITPKLIIAIQKAGLPQKLTGQEKKQIFIDIVLRIINDSSEDMAKEEREELILFANMTLPFIVDGMVFAFKSDYFITLKENMKKCCFKN